MIFDKILISEFHFVTLFGIPKISPLLICLLYFHQRNTWWDQNWCPEKDFRYKSRTSAFLQNQNRTKEENVLLTPSYFHISLFLTPIPLHVKFDLYGSQFPSAIGWRKKNLSYNHKTTIWVSHEYYLNPEFHKILWRAFWVITILVFSPYTTRVDFMGLISK